MNRISSNSSSNNGAPSSSASSTHFFHEGTEGKGFRVNMISAKPSLVINNKSSIDFSSSNSSSSSCSSSKSSVCPTLSSSSNIVSSAQSSSYKTTEQQTSLPPPAPASTLHIQETFDLCRDFSSSCSCSSRCDSCSSNSCSNKGAPRSSASLTKASMVNNNSMNFPSSNSSSSSCSSSSNSSSNSSNSSSNNGAPSSSASSTHFFYEGTEGKGYRVNMISAKPSLVINNKSSIDFSSSNSSSSSCSSSSSSKNGVPRKAYHVAKPSTVNNKSSTIDLCSDSPPPPVHKQETVDLTSDSQPPPARAPPTFLPSASIIGQGLPSLRNIIVTETEHNLIVPLLTGEDSSAILIDKFAIDMSITKFKNLAPGRWLNDEIINFYFEMLMEGCISNNMRIHIFSSFFFTLLFKSGQYRFKDVQRWTKKIDIFTLEKIFIPVNITNSHWTLVLIDILFKTIYYYDSFRTDGPYADAALQVSACNNLFLLRNK